MVLTIQTTVFASLYRPLDDRLEVAVLRVFQDHRQFASEPILGPVFGHMANLFEGFALL